MLDKLIGYDSRTGTWSIGLSESSPMIKSTISPVSSVIFSIFPSDCLINIDVLSVKVLEP